LNYKSWPNAAASIFIFLSAAFISTPVVASDTTETAGDYLQHIIPAVAYGSTFYMEDPDGRMQFYKSFFTNFAATHALKHLIDKKRPNGSGLGFPSGHTSASFQGASFIHKRYGWKYSIPAYAAATFVGYSRVEADRHYVIDVVAGAALGMATSFFFTEPYKGVTVTPVAGGDYFGVTVSKNW